MENHICSGAGAPLGETTRVERRAPGHPEALTDTHSRTPDTQLDTNIPYRVPPPPVNRHNNRHDHPVSVANTPRYATHLAQLVLTVSVKNLAIRSGYPLWK